MSADALGEINRSLNLLHARQRSAETVSQTVQEVVDLAVVTIPGAETAGVLTVRADKTIESVAVTDEFVRAVDRLQSELGEGPCLAAIVNDPIVSLPDTAHEGRWPAFAPAAEKLGVRSMLACRLATPGGTVASLNLHASRPHAFDEQALLLAAVSSAHASVALAAANVSDSLRSTMLSRQRIGEACGILMERHGITSEQAFALLVQTSQHLNIKLRDVAAHIVEGDRDPEAPRSA
jgi:GAF domain-containing protein